MVAIGILTTGFLGIVTLLSKSFFISRVTSDELTATYLASEGVELTKNILDADLWNGGTWGTCGGTCVADGAYTVAYDSKGLTALGVGPGFHCSSLITVPPLQLDPATDMYGYNGSVTTNLARCIQIEHISANEIVVDSVITWATGPLTAQRLDVADVFYNWHPPQ